MLACRTRACVCVCLCRDNGNEINHIHEKKNEQKLPAVEHKLGVSNFRNGKEDSRMGMCVGGIELSVRAFSFAFWNCSAV